MLDTFIYPDTPPPPNRKEEKDLERAQRSALHQLGRTKRSENKTKKNINEAQRSALHQRGYSEMDIRHEKGKYLSESQDYAMRRLGDEKEKEQAAPKEQEIIKESSMAERFTMSLRYHDPYDDIKNTPDKEELPKIFSMADHYITSLWYNQLSDGYNPPSPTIDSREAKIDIDKD